MDIMNAKYKDVRIPFGKYKGNTIYDIAVFLKIVIICLFVKSI
jgi:uncharacterized protein (DUF3820 family)